MMVFVSHQNFKHILRSLHILFFKLDEIVKFYVFLRELQYVLYPWMHMHNSLSAMHNSETSEDSGD